MTRPDLTVTLARNDKDLATVLYKCLELSPSAPPLQRFATPCGLLKGSRIFHDWVKVQLGWPIHQQRSHSSLGTAPAGDAQSIRIISTTNFNLLTWFPYYPPVPPFCRLFEVKLAVAYIQTTLVSARSKGLKVNRKRGYSLITYLSISIYRSNLWVVECWRVPSEPSHCHVHCVAGAVSTHHHPYPGFFFMNLL